MNRLALAFLGLAACSTEVSATGADAPPPDGRSTDARLGTPDARLGTPDARLGTPDAGPWRPRRAPPRRAGSPSTATGSSVRRHAVSRSRREPPRRALVRGVLVRAARSRPAWTAGSGRADRRLARELHPLPAVVEGRAVQRGEQQWMNLVDDPSASPTSSRTSTHLTAKPGVYVVVTLFADPTMKDNTGDFDSEWPSSLGDTNTRYTKLAETFYDNPRVLFGLTNEPHGDAGHDPDLATRVRTRSPRSARSRTRTARRTTSSSSRRPKATRATSRTSSRIRSPAIRSRTRSTRTTRRPTSTR